MVLESLPFSMHSTSFREAKAGSTNLLTLAKEDFFDKDTSKPIRITVTFGDLNQQAKDDLKDYSSA